MNFEQQKRILDIIVASILIVVFFPFWIIVPLAMFIYDQGPPIIFRHKRVGKNGKEFWLLKFRSMVPNADKILHEQDTKLLEKFKQNDWKVQANEDPRITKLGRILRALTIDEFPQLFNVLKGDMSMVGPRAYLKQELDEQTKRYPSTKKYVTQILSVKPGITGVWQTSGRNEISFKQRVKIDANYAKQKSIILDIQILCKTPKAMISKW